MLNETPELMRLAASDLKQLWFGKNNIANAEAVYPYDSDNFRLSPKYHGKYSVVWLYEELLSDRLGWKILLDEAIRCLDQNGQLVVRVKASQNASYVALKNYLYRNILIDSVEISYEQRINESDLAVPGSPIGAQFIGCFKICKRSLDLYTDQRWTFSILTSGTKVENVVKFCESIRKNERNANQILIVGPKNAKYENYKVDYIEKKYSEDYADISVKKNDIAHFAEHENILIAHDRYVLDENFFTGFEKFGYSFDFLTVFQKYESGKLFPAYTAMDKSNLIWSQMYDCRNYNYLWDNQYLNGGLLIFKKTTLKTIKFNPLLFHNQCEDVEISKAMMENGVIPRINTLSSCTTVGVGDDYAPFPIIYKPASLNANLKQIIKKIVKKTILFILKKMFNILPNQYQQRIKRILHE